jgi:positive regulator of sigma E activity
MLKKIEFSKLLLLQESILIWIMSLTFLVLAFFCIWKGYMGSLPWLAAMVAFPWTAYGVSQVFYYRKSMKENSKGGIKFESVMAEI